MDKKELLKDKNLLILKSTFEDNDELLKLVRRLFYGFELTPVEKAHIKEVFASKELVEAMRGKVYGSSFDTPIGQLSDFWMGTEKQVFAQPLLTIKQAKESKKLLLSMFEKAFNLLSNPDGETISVEYNPDEDDELATQLIARNIFLQSIETALLTIQRLSGRKDETLEDVLKRIEKDSTK